jgi:hypothetical protein
MLVRDQEVGGSNPLAPTNLFSSITAAGAVDPTLIRMLHSVGRCFRVLIELPSDDFRDPLRRTRTSGDAPGCVPGLVPRILPYDR